MGISNGQITVWEEEQRTFFAKLEEEASYNIYEVTYVETLQKLRDLENQLQSTHLQFHGFVPVDPLSTSYNQNFSAGWMIETKQHAVNNQITRVLLNLSELKVTMHIVWTDRWTPAHLKFQETQNVERDYQ